MALFGRPDARITISADNKTEAAFKRVNKDLRVMDKSALSVGKAFKGLAAFAGVGGLAAAARGALSAATELQNMSDRLGVGTEFLQAFQYAAAQTGIGAQAASIGLQRFSRRVAEASSGTGELKKILEELKIDTRDAAGNLRPVVDVLGDYANAIKDAGTSGEQLRLAFKAFDSEGAGLVTILRDGKAGLLEFEDAARSAGAVWDQEVTQSLADARQELENFQKQFTVGAGTLLGGDVAAKRGVVLGAAIKGAEAVGAGFEMVTGRKAEGAVGRMIELGQIIDQSRTRMGPIDVPNRSNEVLENQRTQTRILESIDRTLQGELFQAQYE